MDEAVLMYPADCVRKRDRDTQETGQIERMPGVALENPVQGLTTGVLEYEDRAPFVMDERQGCSRAGRIELSCDLVFMFEPAQGGARAILRCHQQDRR